MVSRNAIVAFSLRRLNQLRHFFKF